MGLTSNDVSKVSTEANGLLDRVEKLQSKGVPISLERKTIWQTAIALIVVVLCQMLFFGGILYYLFNRFFGRNPYQK